MLLIFAAYYFFFNDTATTEIYTLSLHDALPIPHHPDSSASTRGSTPAPPPAEPCSPHRPVRSSTSTPPGCSGRCARSRPRRPDCSPGGAATSAAPSPRNRSRRPRLSATKALLTSAEAGQGGRRAVDKGAQTVFEGLLAGRTAAL